MSEILSYTCAESNSHTIKIHFIRLRTTANGTKYLKLYNKKVTAPFIGEYCPSLGYLRMLSKQILFLVRASVDIPTRDNIHRYQLKPVTPPHRAPPPPVFYYWRFQGSATVVVYYHGYFLSTFFIVFDFLFALFKIHVARWLSAGKERPFHLCCL